MISKGVGEIRHLIASESFLSWHRRHVEHRQNTERLRTEIDEMVMQIEFLKFGAELTQRRADELLFSCGPLEEKAAQVQAQRFEVENESFENLNEYEKKSSIVIQRARELKHAQDDLDRARLIRFKLSQTASASHSFGTAEAELRAAQTKYEQAVCERDALWNGVEDNWSDSFQCAMAGPEYLYHSAKIRSAAEALYAEATAQLNRHELLSKQLVTRTQERIAAQEEFDEHCQQARGKFGCAIIRDFLFWPSAENSEKGICVPLVEELNHFNIQVAPLELYEINRDKGLNLIEPITPQSIDDDDDFRLEQFFSLNRASR